MNEDSDPPRSSEPGPQAEAPPGPRAGAEPRRLIRSQEGRLITGVCAGLARYTRIDAIVFRVAFALLVLATGVGVLLYIAAFLLMGAPDGGPSKIERMGRRIFDGDTALALLGAVFAAGMVFGIAGNWGSGKALAVVVVFGLTLLVARSRGVDLVQVARGLPDHIKGRPLSSWTPPPAPAPGLSDGMVDLARLGRRGDTYAAGPYAAASGSTAAHTPPADTAEPSDTVPGPYGTDPYSQGPHAADAAPPPAESPWVRPHRRSYLATLTLLTAVIVGAVLYLTVDDRTAFSRYQVVIAGALAVIACGLFLGAWFGRDRKLVLVGAIMSFALASTSIAGNAAVARKTHHQIWRPVATAQAEQSHKVLVGQGVVDLTTVPLSPGESLRVNAQVTLGVLAVRVPAAARVEIDGHAYLGDITIDRQVTSGPGARVRRVLEPEGQVAGPIPTIVLHIRSKVGDMEVTRVPA
ncbi:PspC domain-containing protein [Actinoallomurus bryophytorum]|nr:PspC domain-containing protein [Actinoallomurus bryophytorum]